MRLVIVGATGMIGRCALQYALSHPAVGAVTTVGRRKTAVSHPKLTEIIHEDFADCTALAAVLSDQDAAIFCLGVYTGSVPASELRRVTVDYTVEFARVLRAGSPGAAFSFLSGAGADQTGRSRIGFARYKGEAERALLEMAFPRLYLFRPAFIYPVEPRKEPNFGYRLLRGVYPALRVLFPNQVIRSDDLARAMVDATLREAGPEVLTLENRDIKAMAPALPTGRLDPVAISGATTPRI